MLPNHCSTLARRHVRAMAVKQLCVRRDLYERFVPDNYEQYVARMKRNGEWGDHVTLQAISDALGMKVSLLTSLESTPFLEIVPEIQRSSRVLWLAYWADVHYDSLYTPEGSFLHHCSSLSLSLSRVYVFVCILLSIGLMRSCIGPRVGAERPGTTSGRTAPTA